MRYVQNRFACTVQYCIEFWVVTQIKYDPNRLPYYVKATCSRLVALFPVPALLLSSAARLSIGGDNVQYWVFLRQANISC